MVKIHQTRANTISAVRMLIRVPVIIEASAGYDAETTGCHMKGRTMKLTIVILALVAAAALAQNPSSEPALSTADKVAIQSLEKQKQDAQKLYQDAQQAESTIEHEFSIAHAGFHLNPATFAVEKDPALPTPPAPKK